MPDIMMSSEDLDFQPFVRGPAAGGGKRVPAPRRSLGNDSSLDNPTTAGSGILQTSRRRASLPASPDVPSIQNPDSDVESRDVSRSPLAPPKSRPFTEGSDAQATTTAATMGRISNPKPLARMARMTPYGGGTNVQKPAKKGGGVLSVFTSSSSRKRAASASASTSPPVSSSTFRPSTLSKPVHPVVGLQPPGLGSPLLRGERGGVPGMVKRRSRSAPPKGLPTLSGSEMDEFDDRGAAVDLEGGGGFGSPSTAEEGAATAVMEMIRSVSESVQAGGVVAIGVGGGGGGLGTIEEVGVGAEAEVGAGGGVGGREGGGGGGGVIQAGNMIDMLGAAVGEGYDIAVFIQGPDSDGSEVVEDGEGDASFVVVEAESESESEGEGERGGVLGNLDSGGSLPIPEALTPGQRTVSRWDTKDKAPALPSALESQPVIPYSGSQGHGSDATLTGGGGESVVESEKPRKQSKFEKEEAHTTLKALSRILKDESKMSKYTLKVALQELEGLHRVHKESMKLEANAITGHSKVKSEYTKALSAVEGVRREVLGLERKLETADMELRLADEDLETHKERVKEAMNAVKRKKDEVDALRALHGAEERDRASQLSGLKKQGHGSGFKTSEGELEGAREGGGEGKEGEGKKVEKVKRDGRKDGRKTKKKGGKEDEEKHHRKRPSKLGMIGLAPLYPPVSDKHK